MEKMETKNGEVSLFSYFPAPSVALPKILAVSLKGNVPPFLHKIDVSR